MNEAVSLRLRAASGDPRAQVRLAHLMLTGRAPASGPGEPLALIAQACAARHSDAFLYHAALAARGHGRPQSLDDAFRYVAEAAATGDTRAKGQLFALGGQSFDSEAWFAPAPMTQRHAAPRVFTIEKFLPPPVCAWLIKQARKNLQPAVVQLAERGGAPARDAARSNSVAGTNLLHPDLVLQMVNLRIAAAIGLPLSHQEATNILHYARGQEYLPHYDFFTKQEEAGFAHELRTIGQRVVTVLVYLNEDYDGGETAFPKLDWRFKGKTGDALVFWNLSAQGEREMDSLHAGSPVVKGEKWLLSKWVRQNPVPLI